MVTIPLVATRGEMQQYLGLHIHAKHNTKRLYKIVDFVFAEHSENRVKILELKCLDRKGNVYSLDPKRFSGPIEHKVLALENQLKKLNMLLYDFSPGD